MIIDSSSGKEEDMKQSRYMTDIEIDENKKMLYSTFSRQYYVYQKSDEKAVTGFLNDLNKGVYTKDEVILFKELLNKKLIVQDDIDELREVEYYENSARYQSDIYKIMIFVTNACNFRCSYCTQSHDVKNISDDTKTRLLKLIEEKSKRYKKIKIDWFGGEPLLEYKKICEMLEQAERLCEANRCELVASMTTNGFLLNAERIKTLVNLRLKYVQITLDGNKKTHDEKRRHITGISTYDTILENIVVAAREGMQVILRINIDKENKDDISGMLCQIPFDVRKQIKVTICNIFQNKEKYSTYELEKQVIGLGYGYAGRYNNYTPCHAGQKNALVINADGEVILCSNVSPNEKRLGYIDAEGKVCIENRKKYIDISTISARDNLTCRNCIELPYCIADCKYARMANSEKCMGKGAGGLSVQERALLDYYSDLYEERQHE